MKQKSPLIDRLKDAAGQEERNKILQELCLHLNNMHKAKYGLTTQALCGLIRSHSSSWSTFQGYSKPPMEFRSPRFRKRDSLDTLMEANPVKFKHELYRDIRKDKWIGNSDFSLMQLQSALDQLMDVGLIYREGNAYAVDFNLLLSWVDYEFSGDQEE